MNDPRPLKYVAVPAGTKFAGDPEPVTIEGLPGGDNSALEARIAALEADVAALKAGAGN